MSEPGFSEDRDFQFEHADRIAGMVAAGYELTPSVRPEQLDQQLFGDQELTTGEKLHVLADAITGAEAKLADLDDSGPDAYRGKSALNEIKRRGEQVALDHIFETRGRLEAADEQAVLGMFAENARAGIKEALDAEQITRSTSGTIRRQHRLDRHGVVPMELALHAKLLHILEENEGDFNVISQDGLRKSKSILALLRGTGHGGDKRPFEEARETIDARIMEAGSTMDLTQAGLMVGGLRSSLGSREATKAFAELVNTRVFDVLEGAQSLTADQSSSLRLAVSGFDETQRVRQLLDGIDIRPPAGQEPGSANYRRGRDPFDINSLIDDIIGGSAGQRFGFSAGQRGRRASDNQGGASSRTFIDDVTGERKTVAGKSPEVSRGLADRVRQLRSEVIAENKDIDPTQVDKKVLRQISRESHPDLVPDGETPAYDFAEVSGAFDTETNRFNI